MSLCYLGPTAWRTFPTYVCCVSKRYYCASKLKPLLCTPSWCKQGVPAFTSAAKSEIIVKLCSPKSVWCAQKRSLHLSSNLSAKRPYEVNTDVQKDVILFRHLNPRWYTVLNLFAVCQFCFWMYSAHLGYTLLKDAPVKADVNEDLPFWRRVNLGEKKYRLGFTLLSIFVGLTLMTTTCLYTAKSVKYLILRKGGRSITIVTHGPFGRNISRTVDLANVSCPASRGSAKGQLPIKVKGNYIHYVLDMRGEFTNPQLFDYTAGLKRNL
ncbi:transmembrane protein 223 [Schistocerca nitens]|uniref:transmembrane protein 223 n=1 Tax=Schistocerca nitens TaxID=7011 RepID=UPI00211767F5|nr:transmembrane protein 223 [Schistocerca nitens]